MVIVGTLVSTMMKCTAIAKCFVRSNTTLRIEEKLIFNEYLMNGLKKYIFGTTFNFRTKNSAYIILIIYSFYFLLLKGGS